MCRFILILLHVYIHVLMKVFTNTHIYKHLCSNACLLTVDVSIDCLLVS